MLNKPVFHKKIPYIDEFNSTEEAFNYIAMVANSSFEKSASPSSSSPLGSLGTMFHSGTLHNQVGSGNSIQTLVFNHNFGSIPSGWIQTDFNAASLSQATYYRPLRTSWSTTQITIQAHVYENVDISFSILVLR